MFFRNFEIRIGHTHTASSRGGTTSTRGRSSKLAALLIFFKSGTRSDTASTEGDESSTRNSTDNARSGTTSTKGGTASIRGETTISLKCIIIVYYYIICYLKIRH